jgi:hypothetical protein
LASGKEVGQSFHHSLAVDYAMLISVSSLRRRVGGAFLILLFFATLSGEEGLSWWTFLAYYVLLNAIEIIINRICCPAHLGYADIYLDLSC